MSEDRAQDEHEVALSVNRCPEKLINLGSFSVITTMVMKLTV